eukprot:Blabericola_migrator_1__5993@NODE_301_length_10180_cov_125_201226_g247_i0_p12_GENE_NODE_301_length_10180_cov_125_201226_g247_i0NODE_301_length_10180_cov_125_201226_g247_i0_p12_ORF_typecomplete_len105_score12_94CHMI/PF02962_15/0_21_NODE_301_length_10180_cov_125_201226_g247_i024242738
MSGPAALHMSHIWSLNTATPSHPHSLTSNVKQTPLLYRVLSETRFGRNLAVSRKSKRTRITVSSDLLKYLHPVASTGFQRRGCKTRAIQTAHTRFLWRAFLQIQ